LKPGFDLFSGKAATMDALRLTLSLLGVLVCGTACGAAEFQAPVRWLGGGKPVRVESPGYAAPCWADVDRDGKKDLLVGQFNQGKVMVYRNLGDGSYAAGAWLKAEGSDVEIPGVW
jgi:hypothetical protein